MYPYCAHTVRCQLLPCFTVGGTWLLHSKHAPGPWPGCWRPSRRARVSSSRHRVLRQYKAPRPWASTPRDHHFWQPPAPSQNRGQCPEACAGVTHTPTHSKRLRGGASLCPPLQVLGTKLDTQTRLPALSMGKNANASRAPRPDDDAGAPAAPGAAATTDGTVDGSFHSPAFLAAHVQRLQSTERVTWEDFKTKQMADARKAALEAAQEEAATLEFRRQLDRDREKRLAKARKDEKKSKSRKRRSRSRSRSPGRKHKSKKERSDKRKHKKSHKRRSRSRSSGDESSSSDSEDSTEKFRLSRWAARC
jgi:hypothetical protein